MKNIHPTLLFLLLLLSKIPVSGQYQTFSESFDLLSTVAGKGDIDDKGVNGWQEAFENNPATQAELSRPHMAMADSIGNLYIADKDAHAIRKVDVNGIITTVAGTNSPGDDNEGVATNCRLSSPNGVWTMADGSFYILDLGNNKIKHVGKDGIMSTVFEDPTGIVLGRGLCVNTTKDTIWYSSGSELKQWTDADGVKILADGFLALGNIALAPDGTIYATDRSANKVFRIDKSGIKTTIAGNGEAYSDEGLPALETAFYEVRAVWVLEDGSYFLGTHEGSQVWYVDTEGIAHVFLNGCKGDENHYGDGENYATPGCKISEVRAVTVDFQGNLIVTENDVGYIRKVAKKDFVNWRETMDEKNALCIYPNPSSTTISIQINTSREAFECTIYNCAGKAITHYKSNSNSSEKNNFIWDCSLYSEGIYFVTLKTNATTCTQKITVLH